MESLRWRAAIVGPEGSGKTTLLLEFADRAGDLGFRPVVRRAGEPVPSLGPRDILLLDSAERLGWAAWRRLRWRTRKAAGLIITAHRPGRLPALLHCTTSPELLAELVVELAGEGAGPLLALARDAYELRGGNVRAALLDLYRAVG